MSRRIEDLAAAFRPLAVELIERIKGAGIDVLVVYTRRTPEEQIKLLAAGRSWTQNSRHLTGHAIDLVPTELAKQPNWAPDDPLWEQMGSIGEDMGLRWGGRWQQRDCPHFELPWAKYDTVQMAEARKKTIQGIDSIGSETLEGMGES